MNRSEHTELKERKSQSSLVASVPRELYTANTGDEDFGAYAAYLDRTREH
jgi:hypothetical protein